MTQPGREPHEKSLEELRAEAAENRKLTERIIQTFMDGMQVDRATAKTAAIQFLQEELAEIRRQVPPEERTEYDRMREEFRDSWNERQMRLIEAEMTGK